MKEYLVKIKTNNTLNTASLASDCAYTKAKLQTATQNRHLKNVYSVEVKPEMELTAVESLKANPNIEWVEENYTVEMAQVGEAVITPQNLLRGVMYHMDLCKVEQAWEVAANKGAGQVVGVVDSGIEATHIDLVSNINDYVGYDHVHNDPLPEDVGGHGTGVSSLIAAVDNEISIVGVAPGAKIMSLKGFHTGGSTIQILGNCILDAVERGVKVINNSWGMPNGKFIEEVIDKAYEAGCILVFAAGNASADISSATAFGTRNEKLLVVAATDKDDVLATFSNYGKYVHIAAPGRGIVMLGLKSKVAETSGVAQNGTSFSSPIVAGAVILMKEVYPNISLAQIKTILSDTADSITTVLDRHTPFGRLNAFEAVKAAKILAESDEGGGDVTPPCDESSVKIKKVVKKIVVETTLTNGYQQIDETIINTIDGC